MEQLDIFEDSRDRVLINRLAEAICGGDAAAARTAACRLQAEFPGDRHLPLAALLADALAAEAATAATPWPADAVADALAARAHLQQHVGPAAQQLLGGADAAGWLAARWRALARRAAALPYSSEHADGHPAALWLLAGGWAEAAAAAEVIASWRRRPVPLAWMAQARWHLHGPDATWPLVAELAWLAPARLPPLMALLPDAAMRRLARRFEADAAAELCAGPAADAWAWWPAWLLIEQPLLAGPLSAAQPQGDDDEPRHAFALLRSLLHLERQARHSDVVAQRRRLLDRSPALFRIYMATR